MRFRHSSKLAVSFAVAALAVAAPLIAGQIKGEIKSIDRSKSQIVVHDEETKKDVTVSLASLTPVLAPGQERRPQGPQARGQGHRQRGVRGLERVDRRQQAEGPGPDAPGVLAQLHPQPLQAAAAVLLPGVPGPDPEGRVRVPLRDLPGPDDLPAAGHRLARRRGAGRRSTRPRSRMSPASCSSGSCSTSSSASSPTCC